MYMNAPTNFLPLSRLADDAMQRDFPERFASRAEWNAYNEECDRHDRDRAHLKGNELDFGDLNDLPY